jgi:hypothetical protein
MQRSAHSSPEGMGVRADPFWRYVIRPQKDWTITESVKGSPYSFMTS